MTETASIDAPIVRIVAPDGTAVGDVEVGLSENERRELLRLMIRSRRLDRECWALQRQGELTVYPPFEGQEAAQVGSAFALGPDDFVFPSFRELAAAVVRGVDVVEYLGNEELIHAQAEGSEIVALVPSDRQVKPGQDIELGVPLDYQCDTYQRALDKIAATAAKHGVAAGMYFIPPGMDPNFYVQKGLKFFTMPWGPWATAGIQNGLSGIKR